MAFSPAFSPDGSRIAFAWSPAVGTNGLDQSDLYVKALGSETHLRLTQHPSQFLRPAWSPDGTQIAFYRQAGADSGIYLVPALGGPERKLRSTQDLMESSISWSPDGKWIAFADATPDGDHTRIYLLSMETLSASQIPINPMCLAEGNPEFSHKGEYLAYWCYRNDNAAAIYSLSLPDGKPKMIAPFGAFPSGLAWSADDAKLIYSRKRGTFSEELSEVTLANGAVKPLGLAGMWPAVSSKGDKLVYATLSARIHLWRRDMVHAEAPAIELIPSSRSQYDAQYSPDGKRIAFASQRSGIQGVWISDEDGSNLVQISDPHYVSGSPQWSPDGNKIVFDSFPGDRWEIYIADIAELKSRKLVTNISSNIRPNWSRDGKWIYFVSGEPGREGVYRCPVSGGNATAIYKGIHGFNPQESFDGTTVYFASGDQGEANLKKVTVSGQPGTESEVDPSLRVRYAQSWLLSPAGIYFVPAEAPRSLRYFEFASRRIRTIFEADSDLSTGLSLDRNGRWILYSQQGEPSGDLMLVSGFR